MGTVEGGHLIVIVNVACPTAMDRLYYPCSNTGQFSNEPELEMLFMLQD